MSVGLDAVMTSGSGTGGNSIYGAGPTSLNGTGITVGASATLLVVTVTLGQATATSGLSCTWNGVAMTLQANTQANNGTNTFITSAIFTLINPTPGLQTIALSWTGNNDAYISAVSFTGTDTTTGVRTADNVTGSSTTGGTQSLAVNTASTDATVVVCGNSTGTEPTPSNQTSLFVNEEGSSNGGASYALGGSGTNTHSFAGGSSGQQAVLAGVHVLAGSVTPLPYYPYTRVQFFVNDVVSQF